MEKIPKILFTYLLSFLEIKEIFNFCLTCKKYSLFLESNILWKLIARKKKLDLDLDFALSEYLNPEEVIWKKYIKNLCNKMQTF